MQCKDQQVTDCMHFHHCDCNGFTQYLDGVEQEKETGMEPRRTRLGSKIEMGRTWEVKQAYTHMLTCMS